VNGAPNVFQFGGGERRICPKDSAKSFRFGSARTVESLWSWVACRAMYDCGCSFSLFSKNLRGRTQGWETTNPAPGATGPSHLGTGDLSTRRGWFYRPVAPSISQLHREMSGNSQTIRGCHSWNEREFTNKQRCHSERTGPRTFFSSGVVSEESALKIHASAGVTDTSMPRCWSRRTWNRIK